MNKPGIYGKLPSHGDFIQRNLPSTFITEWDAWLQYFIAGTKEKLGTDWLDIYLTSPIWRFVLSHGVIDENKWAGILMPSVDLVGRYFPLTVAVKLPDFVNPLEFISMQTSWYAGLEDFALMALDSEFELDELIAELSNLNICFDSIYMPGNNQLETYAMQFELDFEEQSVSSIYPYMLDVLMNKLISSYSAWTTSGSERVSPCIFSVQNLPPMSKIPAMLDGEWERWGWQKPYVLQTLN